ncbi:MAG: trypsin-like peptidase domain-containing protein [Flavobacteriaceae bacterium]
MLARRSFIKAAALAAPVAAVPSIGRAAGAAGIAGARAAAVGIRCLAGDDAKESFGAGFLFDAAGHIATCRHVVAGASEIRVLTHDGRTLKAGLVGADQATDIAVLSVPGFRSPAFLPPAADIPVEPAMQVFAIGDPYGYAGSVTAGVISGLSRRFRDSDPVRYLQHDAALNRGGSGGPLVDAAGNLLGMNAAIADGAFNFIGISLAVPAPLLAAVAGEIASTGRVKRARAALRVQPLSRELAEGLGAGVSSGLLVSAVMQEGGDIVPGDILTEASGVTLEAPADLSEIMLRAAPGDRIAIRYSRGGEMRAGELPLVEAREPLVPQAAADDAPSISLDLDAYDFGAAFRSDVKGAAEIASVVFTGAAANAGLQAGDRIVSAGGRPVAGSAEFEALWRSFPRETLTVLVERPGAPAQFLAISRAAPAPGLDIGGGNRTDNPGADL